MSGGGIMEKTRLNLAIEFAEHFHQGQKWGLFPYMVHLYAVARHFSHPEEKIIAFLHDTVEDGKTTFGVIARLFGGEVARRIELLTRTEETYTEYIQNLARCGDRVVIRVKIADLEENLHSLRFIDQTRKSLIPRYEKSLTILKGVLHEQD